MEIGAGAIRRDSAVPGDKTVPGTAFKWTVSKFNERDYHFLLVTYVRLARLFAFPESEDGAAMVTCLQLLKFSNCQYC